MKTSTWFLLSSVIVAGLAGCSSNSEAPKDSQGAAKTPYASKSADTKGSQVTDGKKLKLAFVTNNTSDFWLIAKAGTEKAAKELPNVEVDFRMPGEMSAGEQKRIVDDLVAKGLDGMAISVPDPKNETDMLNEVAKNAVLITQDSDAPASNRACYIGTDNVAAGKMEGEEIKKALPNGGKIMCFVGKADAQNAKERFDGIKQALSGSKVEIIDLRTDETDRVKAKANVSDTLVKYPDIAGLVGIWSYNGPAILNAVKEAGKVGKVKIICFDEEAETLAGVKDGSIEATVVQQPFQFGYQSVKVMAAVKSGDKTAIPADKKIIVPTVVINKVSVDDFKKKLDEMTKK